eukprot:5187595-Pyramimonas_sp.AAC.2
MLLYTIGPPTTYLYGNDNMVEEEVLILDKSRFCAGSPLVVLIRTVSRLERMVAGFHQESSFKHQSKNIHIQSYAPSRETKHL